jgi:hypothetical protein
MALSGSLEQLFQQRSPTIRGSWAATAAALSAHAKPQLNVKPQRWRPAAPFLGYTIALAYTFVHLFYTQSGNLHGSRLMHVGISVLFLALQTVTLATFLLMFSHVQYHPDYCGDGGIPDIAQLLIVLHSLRIITPVKLCFDPVNPLGLRVFRELQVRAKNHAFHCVAEPFVHVSGAINLFVTFSCCSFMVQYRRWLTQMRLMYASTSPTATTATIQQAAQ